MIKEMKDWIVTLTITILLIIFIRSFIFSPVIVEGESMLPNLEQGDRLLVNKISMHLNCDIKRYDVVVFKTHKDEHYIKRVIGLPGDYIEFKNNELYINDKAIDEPYIIPFEDQKNYSLQSLYGKTVIPKDYYFVLGDNRGNSLDSRFRFIGLIHKDRILGPANRIIWPFNRIKNVSEF